LPDLEADDFSKEQSAMASEAHVPAQSDLTMAQERKMMTKRSHTLIHVNKEVFG